jgi:hypothetical protein
MDLSRYQNEEQNRYMYNHLYWFLPNISSSTTCPTRIDGLPTFFIYFLFFKSNESASAIVDEMHAILIAPI